MSVRSVVVMALVTLFCGCTQGPAESVAGTWEGTVGDWPVVMEVDEDRDHHLTGELELDRLGGVRHFELQGSNTADGVYLHGTTDGASTIGIDLELTGEELFGNFDLREYTMDTDPEDDSFWGSEGEVGLIRF